MSTIWGMLRWAQDPGAGGALWLAFGVCLAAVTNSPSAAAPLSPKTEVEEVVATCAPPGNGAGPLWCYGAPLLARTRDGVFASVMETGPEVPLLCNTRWRLFRRDQAGWQQVARAQGFREREPCPLVTTGPGRLLLSTNPSTQPPGTQYGPCAPRLLAFDSRRPERPPAEASPRWPGAPTFTDHSYRGIAADGRRGDLLLLNIDAVRSVQCWSYRDRSGAFQASGEIAFPIRACYPQVALRDGAAHVLAVGDIVEPREEWRAYKREKTGASWDYVFRRLFYTWTPRIAGRGFEDPLEVESVEATGGHLLNLDLWVGPDGAAHLLYLKTNTTPILRDRFFPDLKIATSLEHVTLQKGRVVARETLVQGGEGRPETPRYARFHAAGPRRLYAVYSVAGTRPNGRPFLENRLLQVLPAANRPAPSRLDLRQPFTTFFTATERGGSAPLAVLDLFGVADDPTTLRYARVRLGGG